MELRQFYRLDRLRKEWECLISDNPNTSVFLDYKYNVNVLYNYILKFFSSGIYPVFVTIYDEGKLIMLAPLAKRIFKQEYLMFGELSGYGETDFIYSSKLQEHKIKECLTKIIEHCGRLKITRMNPNSSIIKAYRDISPDTKFLTCPSVSIPFNEGYDIYYNGLSKSTRQNLRTSYNRLKKDNVAYHLDVQMGQYIDKTSWKEIMNVYCNRQRETYNHSRPFESYYTRYIKHDSRSLRFLPNNFIACLYYGNEIGAVILGFVNSKGTMVTVPRLAINPKFSAFSPGLQCVNECIKYLISNTEVRNLDLSRGSERYKYVMGGIEYSTYSFIMA